jgi:hypothetical protein
LVFTSCRGKLKVMLAGAARGRKEVGVGRLAVLKKDLICHFKLVVDMVRSSVREFVNDADRPEFLERKLMEFSVDGYW